MTQTTIETRRRILVLLDCGFSVSNIQKRLVEEQIYVSKVATYQLIKSTMFILIYQGCQHKSLF